MRRMIKDELLHIHQLLDEISSHLEEERNVQVEEDEYADALVGPYEVFENKQKHEDAVIALHRDIDSAIEETVEETVTPVTTQETV